VYSDVAADHDQFTRIPGSWKRSTSSLRMLAEAGMKGALKCVLTTFNVDRIDNVIALAHELGVAFQFDPNVRPRMSNDRSTLKYALDKDTLANKVFSRRDLYPGFREVQPDRVCHGQDFLHGDSAMCGAGSSTLAVGANGDIYPCGFFPTPVGNLKHNGVREIWERNSALQEMRTMTYAKMTSCPSCDLRSACHPCMAYAQVEHGDYKQCNTASQTSAEALLLVADGGARANAKIERGGKPLVIVGNADLPKVDGTAKAVLAMFD
jgi:radical SAM protein with 4Fe4S-binding SPASM domain